MKAGNMGKNIVAYFFVFFPPNVISILVSHPAAQAQSVIPDMQDQIPVERMQVSQIFSVQEVLQLPAGEIFACQSSIEKSTRIIFTGSMPSRYWEPAK
jgi:hypothetical protein